MKQQEYKVRSKLKNMKIREFKVQTVIEDEGRISAEKIDNRQHKVPPVVVVNATAIITDDAPNHTLTNDDVNAIIKILTS